MDDVIALFVFGFSVALYGAVAMIGFLAALGIVCFVFGIILSLFEWVKEWGK